MSDHDWCISHAASDGPAEILAGPTCPERATDTDAGKRYEAGPELGRGGMGTVSLAHDTVLQRSVAIKRLRVDTPHGRRRLIEEARITARLDHPGIVAVHDAGIETTGRPWYAMRAIRGRTLAEELAHHTTPGARLSLMRSFLEVCQAIAYAHHQGIIHRDLKPSNILLGPFGEVQVTDWGLAIDCRTNTSDRTEAVCARGSGAPAYMSPEAIAGEAMSPRADVWSLGVCLYELLTGQRAYGDTAEAQVRQAVLAAPPPPVLHICPTAPKELAAVVARACMPDPALRYANASDLAEDIKAWLDGQIVSAHDYSALDQVKRLARRNRGVAIGAMVSLVAVLSISVAGGWQVHREQLRTEHARIDAVNANQHAQARLADVLLANSDVQVRNHDRITATRLALEVLSIRPDDARARGILTSARPLPTLHSRVPAPTCSESTLDDQREQLLCLREQLLTATSLADGSTRWERTVRNWSSLSVAPGLVMGFDESNVFQAGLDVRTGRHALAASDSTPFVGASFAGRSDDFLPFRSRHGTVANLLATLDGSTAATHTLAPVPVLPFRLGQDASGTCYFADRTKAIWALSPEAPHWSLRVPARASELDDGLLGGTVSDSGSTALLSSVDGTLEILDLHTGALTDTVTLPVGGLVQVVVSGDGRRVAAIDHRRGVWVWDRRTGQRDRLPGPAQDLGWRADGRLAIAGETLEIWSFPTVPETDSWFLDAGVSALDWQADTFAIATGDGQIQGTYRGISQPFNGPAGIENVAKDVAISPDGTRVLGISLENRWLEIRRDGPSNGTVLSPAVPARRLVWLHGLQLLSRVNGKLQLRNAEGHVLPWSQEEPELLLHPVDVEPAADRRAAVVGTTAGEIYIVEAKASPVLHIVGTVDSVSAVAIGPSTDAGRSVAIAGDSTLSVQSSDGQHLWSVPSQDTILDVAWSPTGDRIASGHLSGRVRVWSQEGVLLGEWLAHTDRVSAVAFSPNGHHLASGSWDATVHFWDLDVLDRPVPDLTAELFSAAALH